MSELVRWQDKDLSEYYNADDVDAVIAEKDNKIEELKQKLEDTKATAYAESVDAGMRCVRVEKELRHHKYKRCLAMARWCEAEMWNIRNTPLCDMNTHEVWQHDDEFWQRWYEHWLKIAEKFKEAK